MTGLPVVRAGGCVVWRQDGSEPEVVVIHRPRWSDWSFPKGKLDPGETTIAAAVREVQEETGLRVGLGPRLSDQQYTVGGQPKTVAYWCARASGSAKVSDFAPNEEVDQVRWVPLAQAMEELTYPHDVDLLDEFSGSAFDSSPLIVVRHAQALGRKSWASEERFRPLRPSGTRQAALLVPLLRAYGVQRVVSSDATRCVDTVRPYVEASGAPLRTDPALSEEGATPEGVRKRVTKAVTSTRRIALCSHRPVLPEMFRAAGVEALELPPAGVVVLHRRAGRVLDTEQHVDLGAPAPT